MKVRYNLICLSIMMGFGSSMQRASAKSSKPDVSKSEQAQNISKLVDDVARLSESPNLTAIQINSKLSALAANEPQINDCLENLNSYLTSDQFLTESDDVKSRVKADARVILELIANSKA